MVRNYLIVKEGTEHFHLSLYQTTVSTKSTGYTFAVHHMKVRIFSNIHLKSEVSQINPI